jgi:hypothetical protein
MTISDSGRVEEQKGKFFNSRIWAFPYNIGCSQNVIERPA